MPITAVNPTPIPSPGQPLPNPADLSSWPIRMAEMHRWMRETLSPGAELIGSQSYTNALAAQEAAVLAYINANFKGAWSALTGALTVPSLVSHSGERWNLLSDLADVTTSEPGIGAEWELFELPSALGVGFDPSGTSLSATNVQAALSAVSAVADEALIDFTNPILNGGMRVAQAGTSFALTSGFNRTLDGCGYVASGSSAVTVSQQSASTPDNPNAKWMIATVTTADTSIAASENAFMTCLVEGYDIAAYQGNTFTLGFWVKSSVPGVHGIALLNEAANLRYISSVNIAAANTPQFASITVDGGIPATGTWNFANGIGLRIDFCMAAGTSLHAGTGAWATGGQIAPASQVNVLATVGNVFGITEVQINPGSVAKQYKHPPLQAELARCQRYYEESLFNMLDDQFNSGYGSSGSRIKYRSLKRGLPVVSASVSGSLGGGDSITLPLFYADADGFQQTTAGVWNAFSGQYRPYVTLKIISDARL